MKTLGALVVAMTVGSLALILMNTAPIRPLVTNLSAVTTPTDEPSQAISQTDGSIKVAKWRHLVVHTSTEAIDAESDCHFIIDPAAGADGRILRTTALWNRQVSGNHVFASGHNWNADSIGVCLIGNFADVPPTSAQLAALTHLVRLLQQTCGITADRVYLARDIDPRCASPGEAFPAKQFNTALMRPRAL